MALNCQGGTWQTDNHFPPFFTLLTSFLHAFLSCAFSTSSANFAVFGTARSWRIWPVMLFPFSVVLARVVLFLVLEYSRSLSAGRFSVLAGTRGYLLVLLFAESALALFELLGTDSSSISLGQARGRMARGRVPDV